MDADDSVSRRGFLRAATGTAAAVGVAGAASGSAAAQSSQEVIVGPGGELVYEPAELYVSPGTTVNFVWESDNHNIVVDSQPEEGSWDGHEPLENDGFEYSHTFETMGEYSYFCQPHQSAGMVGTVIVNESGEAPSSGGGGGGGPPAIPDSAKTLGIATTVGMASTLGLAYFFMRYGGDYEIDE
jgi:plastocyanin